MPAAVPFLTAAMAVGLRSAVLIWEEFESMPRALRASLLVLVGSALALAPGGEGDTMVLRLKPACQLTALV